MSVRRSTAHSASVRLRPRASAVEGRDLLGGRLRRQTALAPARSARSSSRRRADRRGSPAGARRRRAARKQSERVGGALLHRRIGGVGRLDDEIEPALDRRASPARRPRRRARRRRRGRGTARSARRRAARPSRPSAASAVLSTPRSVSERTSSRRRARRRRSARMRSAVAARRRTLTSGSARRAEHRVDAVAVAHLRDQAAGEDLLGAVAGADRFAQHRQHLGPPRDHRRRDRARSSRGAVFSAWNSARGSARWRSGSAWPMAAGFGAASVATSRTIALTRRPRDLVPPIRSVLSHSPNRLRPRSRLSGLQLRT